jgi:hypothetical protein
MAKTKWEEYVEKNNIEIPVVTKNQSPEAVIKEESSRTVKPWDFFKPGTEIVSEEERNNRYSICLACPELMQLTKQCKKCGCFMAAKTKLQGATCPIGKW